MSVRDDKAREKAERLKRFDDELRAQGNKYIAGVDEVGRGCLAGPVMSACVILKSDFAGIGIDDSKKLSQKKREEMFDIIMQNAVAVGIGRVENDTVDEINILNATKLAMREAIVSAQNKLMEKGEKLDVILIDALELPEVQRNDGSIVKQIPIVKGDASSLSIAAASIVAKVTRDGIMEEFDIFYPGYGFGKNKGYGTKAHYEGIKTQGIAAIHRKTFLKGYI